VQTIFARIIGPQVRALTVVAHIVNYYIAVDHVRTASVVRRQWWRVTT